MQTASEWLHEVTSLSPEVQTKLLTSIIIVLLLWLARTVVVRLVFRRTEDVRARYRWRKTVAYVAVLLGMFLAGRVWFRGIQSLATFLGLLTAGLAIALKDLVTGIAGWIFIVWRRPFGVGDRIQIGSHAGDVIDIRIFQFTLMEVGNWVEADQSTGRIIHVPNGMVLSEVLANYSKGFKHIWHEIPVLITFESNWEKAKEILQRISNRHGEQLSTAAEKRLKEASKKFMIFYEKLTPIVYTSVRDSGVLLTIRYLCEPRRRRSSEEAMWEEILREFGKCSDIDFAYPTRRFFNSTVEGKAGRKSSSPEDTDSSRE